MSSTSAASLQQSGRHRCQLTATEHILEPWQVYKLLNQYIQAQDADSRGYQFQHSLLSTRWLYYPFRPCILLIQGEILLI